MSWPESWQRDTAVTQLLRPLALLYKSLSAWDRRRKRQHQESLPVPVVVVGNLVVGGTGKTPFIAWLVQQLRLLGHHPGVISRGYGGHRGSPRCVQPSDFPDQVGDEPLMLANMVQVPVAVGHDRLATARLLLAQEPSITVLISDDGLQHLSMPRQFEFCLFDGRVGVGNARLLPAGPLREPLTRLSSVDVVVAKGRKVSLPDSLAPQQAVMQLALAPPRHLSQPEKTLKPAAAQNCVALCGIGQPESFFALLRQGGWRFDPFPVPDHATLSKAQLTELSDRTVLMTSKDAVKLRHLELPFEAYEVPLTVSFMSQEQDRILSTLCRKLNAGQTEISP